MGKFAFVGALASMFHDMIMTPTETIKQRLQIMRSENSLIETREVVKRIYKN